MNKIRLERVSIQVIRHFGIWNEEFIYFLSKMEKCSKNRMSTINLLQYDNQKQRVYMQENLIIRELSYD